MSDEIRLTDKVGVVGIDGTDYPNEEHATTVSTEYLVQAVNILDTLGWDQVDVNLVEAEGADHPLLMLKPPRASICGGDHAGLAVTPRTKDGRKRGIDDE